MKLWIISRYRLRSGKIFQRCSSAVVQLMNDCVTDTCQIVTEVVIKNVEGISDPKFFVDNKCGVHPLECSSCSRDEASICLISIQPYLHHAKSVLLLFQLQLMNNCVTDNCTSVSVSLLTYKLQVTILILILNYYYYHYYYLLL